MILDKCIFDKLNHTICRFRWWFRNCNMRPAFFIQITFINRGLIIPLRYCGAIIWSKTCGFANEVVILIHRFNKQNWGWICFITGVIFQPNIPGVSYWPVFRIFKAYIRFGLLSDGYGIWRDTWTHSRLCFHRISISKYRC